MHPLMHTKDEVLDDLGRIVSATLVWPDGLESTVEQVWDESGKCIAVTFDGETGTSIALDGEPSAFRHFPCNSISLQAILQNCSLWDHNNGCLTLGGDSYRVVGWDPDIWSFKLEGIDSE